MDQRIRLILTLIESTSGIERLTITTASELLGLSEARLRRLFKQGVGISWKRYLTQTKMGRAAAMLGDDIRPIKAIASNLGYDDLSNFYRDFKNVYAMTPGEMRDKFTSRLLDIK